MFYAFEWLTSDMQDNENRDNIQEAQQQQQVVHRGINNNNIY